MTHSAADVCDYRTMVDDREWSAVGEQVRQVRLSMGMSQNELARAVGLDRTMLAKVEAGTRRLDAFELLKLSSALGVSMDYLIEPQPEVLSRRSAQITEDSDSQVARSSQRLEIALTEWLRELRQLISHGVLRSRPVLRYPGAVASEAQAREAALWVRQQLGLGDGPIDSVVEVCERAGQFILVTDVPGDGASLVEGDVAAAVVSTTGDPGRRRATAAHELGHLVIGDEYSSDLGVHASRADREAAIDAFAAELLLPVSVLGGQQEVPGGLTRDRLVEIAARYRVSWSLALRQAVRSRLIDTATRAAWSQSRPTHAEFMEALGWAPQPDLFSVRVPPSYAHAVMEAWRGGWITRVRAVELMHGQIAESDLPESGELEIEP
ncbi:XRE family transcriptional regulator [Micromonospora sp. RTP1Z1]|uniref:helix-turn-helix domain-containing protein n=1 Tax=Micromonospora sp. RTP1Z1 TaxID=2994043 RepID=UPI0029C902C8|nr:XRE family transcriptional regulator [Micromonospora sp. RTP1Z1]